MGQHQCLNCGEPISESIEVRLTDLFNEVKLIKAAVRCKTKDQWLDKRGVCKYTSLSESTIRRAITKGTLKHSKATGKLMFKVSWVDRFMEGK